MTQYKATVPGRACQDVSITNDKQISQDAVTFDISTYPIEVPDRINTRICSEQSIYKKFS